MEVSSFVYKGIDVWNKTDNLWRILNSYERKMLLDIAFLNHTALIMFYQFKDALKRYAKKHGKTGEDMKNVPKVRILIVILLHNLSRFIQSDFLSTLLQWSNMIYPCSQELPSSREWRNLDCQSIEIQFSEVNALFNRYWYNTISQEQFWEIIAKRNRGKQNIVTEYVLPHKSRNKPLTWLAIWWTVRSVPVSDKPIPLDRPSWKLLKVFDEILIPTGRNKTNNLSDDGEWVVDITGKEVVVENMGTILRSIRMELADYGLRSVNRVDDALKEGWRPNENTKTDLRNRIVEWVVENSVASV